MILITLILNTLVIKNELKAFFHYEIFFLQDTFLLSKGLKKIIKSLKIKLLFRCHTNTTVINSYTAKSLS